MKKYKHAILCICVAISILLLAGAVSAAGLFGYGDVNGDGSVNLKDVTQLRRDLAAVDVTADPSAGNPDANGDGSVNLKDVTFLQRYLAGGWGIELPEDGTVETTPGEQSPLAADLAQYTVLSTSRSENGITCTSFRYGQSVRQRDLVCWSISPEEFTRTVLLNFEIHGWEDSYAADGQLLVDLGNALVSHYAAAADMQNCRLLIIPSANPDGLAEGYTNNGTGRCNYDGIDLNRDFDANHVVNADARYYTPYPFSAVESQALRDLVWASNPDVVVDFHGWLNYTIGSSDLAEVFSMQVGLHHKNELTTSASGYFSYWAQLQGAEAILVEFQDTASIVDSDVILAVDRLITGNYGSNQHDYERDDRYAGFDGIECFALSDGRIYTHQTIGSPVSEKSYIDGSTDKCTVMQIYENGWCKVRYPVGTLTKTAYCLVSAFIDPACQVEPYAGTVAQDTYVYTTRSMTTRHGSVWNTDSFTVVAEEGGLAQIIYPLDDGGYKMGWIDAGSIQ